MAAADYTSAGAFNIDGRWATAIRFEAALAADGIAHVQLRFMNGRSELAAADLDADAAQRLLGSQNYDAILQAAASAQGAASVKGELRGKHLAFRRVTLATASAVADNTVEADERVPGARMEATQGTAPEAQAAVDAAEPVSGPTVSLATRTAVPPWVKQRFLNVGNRYYFPDRTLAFTDDGLKLKAESHNTELVRGVLAIAEARDWTSIRVNGSVEFRREVWRQAQLLGIDVRGYEPSDVEKAASSRSSADRGSQRRRRRRRRKALRNQVRQRAGQRLTGRSPAP